MQPTQFASLFYQPPKEPSWISLNYLLFLEFDLKSHITISSSASIKDEVQFTPSGYFAIAFFVLTYSFSR